MNLIRNFIWYLVVFGLIVLFSGCQSPADQTKPLKIAISKGIPVDSYQNYYNWINAIDSTVIIEEMYHRAVDSAGVIMENCDGLLLTGGTDIYPGRYGKEADTNRCWKPDFKRDSLEMLLIATAVKNKIPILGICRGHQNLNVYFDGTLIIDIPTDYDTTVKHRLEGGYDCYHNVNIEQKSLLWKITGEKVCEVNSAHHQAVENIAANLVPIAFADDGLIEALTYKTPENKPFLLGVQWHPERLPLDNPLSGKIGRYFLNKVRESKTQKQNE